MITNSRLKVHVSKPRSLELSCRDTSLLLTLHPTIYAEGWSQLSAILSAGDDTLDDDVDYKAASVLIPTDKLEEGVAYLMDRLKNRLQPCSSYDEHIFQALTKSAVVEIHNI